MQSLQKMVVVVTGASAGLGRHLALQAGRQGAKVALLARRKNKLKELQKIILGERGEAIPIPADVTNPKAVRDAFMEIESTWGEADILFNSAGVVEPIAPLLKNSDAELLTSLKTNVFGVYIATREALKQMVKQENGGTVINITSGAAQHPYAGWTAYCSQKAAVDMFTRSLALEVSNKNIRIAAISPGTFESHMQQTIRATSEEDFPERPKFIKLYEEGKLADPDDVARVLLQISLTKWPELNGQVADLRSPDFKTECTRHGIEIDKL